MVLKCFFDPKSVAVIGSSTEKNSIGYSITKTLKKSFKGKIYPINPKYKKVEGLKCYPSIKSVEADLAVIVVPVKIVPTVLRECVDSGIGGVVLITAGYTEIGNVVGEEELRNIIKGSKTRIIGANCLGILDTHTGLDTLFLPEPDLARPKKGGISFISQSGAFGSTLVDLIAYENIGLAKFVSYGNQTDVKDYELLEFFGEDPLTNVIVIYMEGVSDGKKFLDVAKDVSRKKPIIIYKAGKTKEGSESASSHTGSLAGSYEIYKTLFKQSGIIEAETVEEIYDMAKAIEFQKTCEGDRIAVVTNGGGFGVVASDYIIKTGLKLAKISDNTKLELKKIIPSFGSVHNPLDLIGDADHIRYEKALEILIREKNIDGILIIALLQTVSLTPKAYDSIIKIKKKTNKPFVVCSTGGEYTQKFVSKLEDEKIPVYLTPERAVKAMKALVKI